jgi:hypothetical protein
VERAAPQTPSAWAGLARANASSYVIGS